MQYLHVYYLVIAIVMNAMPIVLKKHPGYDSRLVATLCATLISMVYLVGMLRTDGVDFEVYRQNFEESYEDSIPDWGFRLLIDGFRLLHLPFSGLMLLIGMVSILATHRLARAFDLNFALLLLLWFMHMAVVKDFSQTRIGFAVSIAIIGLTSKSVGIRGLAYLLAIGMHLTAAVFVMAYEFCRWTAALRRPLHRGLLLGAMLLTVLAAGRMLAALAFLDPRIDIYLNWEREGYGVPVESYGSLILHGAVILVAWLCRRHWNDDPRFRVMFYLEFLGVVCFIAFSDIAIFAFRLSNVLVSLYPVLLAQCLTSLYATPGRMSLSRATAMAQAYAFSLLLLLRPGSYEILAAMSFS